MKVYSELSPVDLPAKRIVKIAQHTREQNIFHLNRNRPIYHSRLLEFLERLHIGLQVVNKDTFDTALRNTVKSRSMEYVYKAFRNDMDENGKLLCGTNIHIENDFAVWFYSWLDSSGKKQVLSIFEGMLEVFGKSCI